MGRGKKEPAEADIPEVPKLSRKALAEHKRMEKEKELHDLHVAVVERNQQWWSKYRAAPQEDTPGEETPGASSGGVVPLPADFGPRRSSLRDRSQPRRSKSVTWPAEVAYVVDDANLELDLDRAIFSPEAAAEEAAAQQTAAEEAAAQQPAAEEAATAGGSVSPPEDAATPYTELAVPAPFAYTKTRAEPMVLSPRCGKCHGPVDTLRCQIMSKGMQTYKCDHCNSKTVQLHRMFGHWPPRAFSDLGPEFERNFWASAKAMTRSRDLKELVVNTITKARIEQEEATCGGRYLPLSVYANQGFDVELIKAHCTDTEEHEFLGTCYRVKIKEVLSRTIEEAVRKELFKLEGAPTSRPALNRSQTPARAIADAPLPDDTANAPARRGRPRGRASLSCARSEVASRSRSGARRRGQTTSVSRTRSPPRRGRSGRRREASQSRGRNGGRREASQSRGRNGGQRDRTPRRKHSKSRSRSRGRGRRSAERGRRHSERDDRRTRSEERRERREAERREKEEAAKARAKEKEDELKARRERDANTRLATRIVAKISALATTLDRDCGDPKIKHVPEYASNPAKKAKSEIGKLKIMAEAVLASRGEKKVDVTLDDVDAMFKEGAAASSLLARMLTSAHKHA